MEKYLEDWNNGLSVRKMELKYDINKNRIIKLLGFNGISLEDIESRYRTNNFYYDIDVKSIIDLWNSGYIIREITEKTGYSRSIISSVLEINGISGDERWTRSQSKWLDIRKQIYNLYRERYSESDIIKKLNTCR